MTGKYLCVLVLVLASSGCGKVMTQSYVMTKERVDIEQNNGNAGYIMGAPKYEEPGKKTRRVYVLEVTKAIPEGEARKIREETSIQTQAVVAPETPTGPASPLGAPSASSRGEGNQVIVIPPLDEQTPPAAGTAAAAAAGPKEAVMYTVQKDDTLQKIAKKFYGSYGKWVKIYDANKDKMKNPNFVKPDTVLTIPAAQEKQ